MKQTYYPQCLGAAVSFALLLPALSVAQPNPQRVIEKLDTDGDNLISYDEYEPHPQHRRDGFDSADADSDGSLSREEMEAQLARHVDEMTARRIERFEAADLDGDGVLTEEERKRAGFDRVDANDDGYISADELEVARRARREHHRPQPNA